jgi:exopolysaccharide biosynthesis polyprenyl glycosylphosphotransferase
MSFGDSTIQDSRLPFLKIEETRGALPPYSPHPIPGSGFRHQRRRHSGLPHRLLLLEIFCDAAVISYALFVAQWVRFHSALRNFHTASPFPDLRDALPVILCATTALLFILSSFHVYEKQSLLRYRYVGGQVVKACAVWTAAFLGVAMLFSFHPLVSRLFVVLGAALVSAALLIWRGIFHRILRGSILADLLRQRIVCIGWNPAAARFLRCVRQDESPAYTVVGCVSAGGEGITDAPAVIPVIGDLCDLAKVIARHDVDLVLLTDVELVKSDIVGLVNLCEKEMVQFKVIPSYFQILISGLHLQTVNGIPVLGVTELPLDRLANVTLKRSLDFIGAFFGLILSAPLIAVFCFLVRRESPGPVFYRQWRQGHRGCFEIIKIRSMRLDAEKAGVGWSTKADDRRLKIGAFMRRWNIDELPQFWNVLKGDMSLVGPRPERPELIQNFKEEIPHYNARHNAKPGITGWAQVKGFRGDTDLTERIRCDLFYLENWSLLLDLQIMAMTLTSAKNAC